MRTARWFSPFLIVLCSSSAPLIGCSSSDGTNVGGVDSGKHDSGQDSAFDTSAPDTTVDDATVDSDTSDTTGDDASATETGDDATADATTDDAADSTADTTTDDAAVDSTADTSTDDTAVDSTADTSTDDTGADAIVDDADATADTTTDDADSAAADTDVADTLSDASDAAPAGPTAFYVLRLGDGTAALSSAATPGFLEKHLLTDGSLVGSPVALPIAASGANQPITFSGSSTAEGALSLSADGRYVVLAGYAATPGTASIAGTAATATPRVVARVDATGAVDTTTTLGTTAFSAGNARGATSADGTAFWVVGSNSGIWYVPLGSNAATAVSTGTPTNNRTIAVFGGQLYGSSGSGTFTNVFTIGSGLPTTSGATITSLPGMPTSAASPYGFAFFDRSSTVAGVDTLYVCDDRAATSGGGIQKWTSDGATWTLTTTFNLGVGCRGLAAYASGTSVTLIASTTESTANKVVMVVDDGSATPTVTTWATAATSTIFRGVALAP